MQRFGVEVPGPLAPAVIGRRRVAQKRDQEHLLQARQHGGDLDGPDGPGGAHALEDEQHVWGLGGPRSGPPRSCSRRSGVGCGVLSPPTRRRALLRLLVGPFLTRSRPKGHRLTVRREGYGPAHACGSCPGGRGRGRRFLAHRGAGRTRGRDRLARRRRGAHRRHLRRRCRGSARRRRDRLGVHGRVRVRAHARRLRRGGVARRRVLQAVAGVGIPPRARTAADRPRAPGAWP